MHNKDNKTKTTTTITTTTNTTTTTTFEPNYPNKKNNYSANFLIADAMLPLIVDLENDEILALINFVVLDLFGDIHYCENVRSSYFAKYSDNLILKPLVMYFHSYTTQTIYQLPIVLKYSDFIKYLPNHVGYKAVYKNDVYNVILNKDNKCNLTSILCDFYFLKQRKDIKENGTLFVSDLIDFYKIIYTFDKNIQLIYKKKKKYYKQKKKLIKSYLQNKMLSDIFNAPIFPIHLFEKLCWLLEESKKEKTGTADKMNQLHNFIVNELEYYTTFILPHFASTNFFLSNIASVNFFFTLVLDTLKTLHKKRYTDFLSLEDWIQSNEMYTKPIRLSDLANNKEKIKEVYGFDDSRPFRFYYQLYERFDPCTLETLEDLEVVNKLCSQIWNKVFCDGFLHQVYIEMNKIIKNKLKSRMFKIKFIRELMYFIQLDLIGTDSCFLKNSNGRPIFAFIKYKSQTLKEIENEVKEKNLELFNQLAVKIKQIKEDFIKKNFKNKNVIHILSQYDEGKEHANN